MELVFATNNLNKLKEVQALLPSTITLLSLKDIGCLEDIPETQLTIKGNAKQKASYIKDYYGYDCFSDDTKPKGCENWKVHETKEIQLCYCNTDFCNSPNGELDRHPKTMTLKSHSPFRLKPFWILNLSFLLNSLFQ